MALNTNGFAGKASLKIKTQSRGELIVDKITNSIINGELTDGELLPPEGQLCEIFGISRSILREAIRVLVSKGLLDVKQGYGTFVRLPQIDVPVEAVRNYLMTHTFSLAEIMEVRIPIELEMTRLAAERRDDSHVERMEESLSIMKDHFSSVEEQADADEAFHRVIIAAAKNSLFGIMINSIMSNQHIGRTIAIRHFGIHSVIKEHEGILEAIKNQKPTLAKQKMESHMNSALERIGQINELLARE